MEMFAKSMKRFNLHQEFLKFVGPRGQKIMRSANIVGPRVRQTCLNDVFTFLTEGGNAGRIVNTGTSSVNSEFVTTLNT
jgi:ABC-type thiamine transport system substrate-binding protein